MSNSSQNNQDNQKPFSNDEVKSAKQDGSPEMPDDAAEEAGDEGEDDSEDDAEGEEKEAPESEGESTKQF